MDVCDWWERTVVFILCNCMQQIQSSCRWCYTVPCCRCVVCTLLPLHTVLFVQQLRCYVTFHVWCC
jgi:hypothetical protein